MILTPVFGKYYETKEELLTDYYAGQSFLADKPRRSVTRADIPHNAHVTFMYNNDTRVLIIINKIEE
jgi:hypothetical protein